MLYVKPAPGLVIRDPDMLDFLPEAGRAVPETDYWHRRVRDGDVIEAQPCAETPADVSVEAPADAMAPPTESTDQTGE
jgi:hypothetical protein